MICALAMHRDACERASERARIGGKRAASSAPPSLSRPTAAMHAAFPSARRPSSHGPRAPHSSLPPSSVPPTVARSTTPSQYLGLRKKEEKEGLRRTDGRRTDADCQRGFKCSAFFRKAARSRRLRLGGRGRGRAGGIQLYRMADGRRADADGWEGALIFLAPSRDYRSLQSYLRLHEFGDTVQ